MTSDFKQELKATFRNCKWAVQELVYDAKMTEWNKICSKGTDAGIDYLVRKYGDNERDAIATICDYIQVQKKIQLPNLPWHRFRFYIARHHAWAVEEIIEYEKEQQAWRLWQSNNLMYDYLRKTMTGREVLTTISRLVIEQRRRRKSTNFRKRWLL